MSMLENTRSGNTRSGRSSWQQKTSDRRIDHSRMILKLRLLTIVVDVGRLYSRKT